MYWFNLHCEVGASVCSSCRDIVDIDGNFLCLPDADEGVSYTDTSCLCFFRPAFELLPLWGMMPRALSPICDRIMWSAITSRGMSRACSSKRTVAFRSQYAYHYRCAGRNPPDGSKEYNDLRPAIDRFNIMSLEEQSALLMGATHYLQKP